MIQLPEHTHPKSASELKEHLAIEDRWPRAVIIMYIAAFIIGIIISIVAGLLYREWL